MPLKQQNGGGGGNGDQIKKFRKVKSMKEADPDGFRKTSLQSSQLGLSPAQQKKLSTTKVTNGLPNQMERTSRFDAIKDKPQVSTVSLPSYTKMKSMNNLETSISSSNQTGSKAVDKELVRTSGLRPVRSSMKKNSGVGIHPTVNLSRATCSSTFKNARNPESLDLDESNRASNVKLCSYKYCSLHGQKKHEMSLCALKCFLSARKKSTNGLKQKERLSMRKYGRDEINHFKPQGSQDEVQSVDIVKGINWMILGDHDEANQLQESYSVTSFEDNVDNNSEISIEEIKLFKEHIQYVENKREEEAHLETEERKTCYVDWEKGVGPYLHSQSNSSQHFEDFIGQTQDSNLECGADCFKFTLKKEKTLSTSSHADSKLLPETESGDVKVDHEIQQSTKFSSGNEVESEKSVNGSLQSGVELPNSSLEADLENLEVNCEKPVLKANVEAVEGCEPSKHETSYDSELGIRSNYDKDRDVCNGLENEKKNVTDSESVISEIPLAELTNRPKERYSNMKKTTAENQENARKFNSRPPRLLPLKPEQEVEVVNLKHQSVEERKTAEEWMVDYALRNTLRRMAPARKRKVALLVAAFESVIQQEQSTTVS